MTLKQPVKRDSKRQRSGLRRGGLALMKAAAWIVVFALVQAVFSSSDAVAQEKIRIGIIGPFSGPFAAGGAQFRNGIDAYQALYGITAGGRQVELVFRDTAGTDPAVARRMTEELIVREKVSLIGGFYLSTEGIASAQILTETKTPAVMFVGGVVNIAKFTPYLVRVGTNTHTHAVAMAEWANRRGFKRAYVAVADYGAGHDLQSVVESRITAAGGAIVGRDRMPLNTVDYAPFAERIANAKPDVIEMFIPPGAPTQAFMKALVAQGVLGTKTPIIGIAETDDPDLKTMDDNVIGVHTALFYAPDVPGEPNKKFKEALEKLSPGTTPNYAMVGAFDGMHVLYSMIESQKGKPFDGTAAVEAVKGMSWASPRGPVRIVPEARELMQNVYVRQVQKIGGRLINQTVDTFENVPLP